MKWYEKIWKKYERGINSSISTRERVNLYMTKITALYKIIDNIRGVVK